MANENEPATRSKRTDELSIPVTKLGLVNHLGAMGIDGVQARLQRLDDYGATVETELVKNGYVDLAGVDRVFDDEVRAGVRSRLTNTPGGHAFVLFPLDSANNAAALMLSSAVDDLDDVDPEMARDALTELGGIMASGFLDAWANAFDERIDLGAPEPVHNTEREIVEKTLRASQGGNGGVYITSRLRLPDHGVLAQVYLFPKTETFVRILDQIDRKAMTG